MTRGKPRDKSSNCTPLGDHPYLSVYSDQRLRVALPQLRPCQHLVSLMAPLLMGVSWLKRRVSN
jgi:hypothetical protein